jgi:hypothetical protein
MQPDPRQRRFSAKSNRRPPDPPRRKVPVGDVLPSERQGLTVTRALPCPCGECRGSCPGSVLFDATMWVDDRRVRPLLGKVRPKELFELHDPTSLHRTFHVALSPFPDQTTCSDGCVLSAQDWADGAVVAFLSLAMSYSVVAEDINGMVEKHHRHR